MGLKLEIETACIENDDESQGYCLIKVMREQGETWLQIHGNQDPAEYPLVLSTNKEIDDFCKKLKKLLTEIK